MRNWLILVAIAIAVLVGALAFGLANLNSYLNRNKDWIAGQVRSALGRSVTFSEIGVSFLDGFGAYVSDLHVADDPAFSRDEFLRVRRVHVAVKILPAIVGRYEVEYIRLDEPFLSVIRNAAGFNFDSLGKRADSAARVAAEKHENASGRQGAGGGIPLLISNLEIRGGEVHFADRASAPPTDVTVRRLDVTAGDVGLLRPIRLQMAASVLGAPEQNLSVTGTIGPVPLGEAGTELPVDLRLKFGPASINDLRRLGAPAAALPAALSSADPVRLEAAVTGTLAALDLNAHLDATGAAVEYGSQFAKPRGTRLDFAVRAGRTGPAIRIEDFTVALADLKLSAKGEIRIGETVDMDLQLDSNRASLSGWEQLLPALTGYEVSGSAELHARAKGQLAGGRRPQIEGRLELADVAFRQSGSLYEVKGLTTTVQFTGTSAVLPPTRFSFGGSPIRIQARVRHFQPLGATFEVESPALHLSALGAGNGKAEIEEVIRDLALRGTVTGAASGPRIKLSLTSARGNLCDVNYRDLDTQLQIEGKVASLDKISVRAFGGRYEGKGTYHFRSAGAPKFDITATMRDVAVGEVFAAKASGRAKLIEGKLNGDLSLSGAGNDWAEIQKSLGGNGRIEIKDGTLPEVNLAEALLTSLTGIPGLSGMLTKKIRKRHPKLFGGEKTPFDTLRGELAIAGGRAAVSGLHLEAEDYTIRAEGSIGLDRSVDLRGTLAGSPSLTSHLAKQVSAVQYLTDARGRLNIPFRLKGTLPHARPSLDTKAIRKTLQRGLVSKGLLNLFGGKHRKRGGTGAKHTPRPQQELLRKGVEGLFGR